MAVNRVCRGVRGKPSSRSALGLRMNSTTGRVSITKNVVKDAN